MSTSSGRTDKETVVAESIDGRRARSERSKNAIIDAALALIREGTLVPTAQQISDRAGVGMRTFFRHFDDMETLFASVDKRARASYERLFKIGDLDGSFDERVERAVAARGEAYDQLKNMALSTRAQLWRSDVLIENYARNQRKLRDQLELLLPEVKALSKDRREAVDAMTSFEMWDRLRSQQGLSKKMSVEIISGLIRDLANRD